MALAFDANLGSVKDNATLTTSAAAAAGSRVFVFMIWYGDGQTCTGMSGGGLTWVVDYQVEFVNDGDHHFAYLSADAPSGLASSTVLTPSFSAGPDFGPTIAAVSFTGVATGASGYVDVTATPKEDFNEDWETNNLVTTNADDLLFGLSLCSAVVAHAADTNYTEIHDIDALDLKIASVYRIVASTSTYTPGGVWSDTSPIQKNIGIAYKAAAGGPIEVDITQAAETDEAQALDYGFPPVQNEPEVLRIVRSGTVYR